VTSLLPSWLSSDAACFAASAAAIAAHHLSLSMRRRRGGTTLRSDLVEARGEWARSIMRRGEGLLAVQTLRNSIMAATFMASTAVLLIVGLLSSSSHGDAAGPWSALDPSADPASRLWLVKTAAILLDLTVSFLSFAMAIRSYNHAGYLIAAAASCYGGAPRDGEAEGGQGEDAPIVQAESAIHQIELAGTAYWIGMRSYFVLIPLAAWLFGPSAMLAAAVLLVPVMRRLDASGTTR